MPIIYHKDRGVRFGGTCPMGRSKMEANTRKTQIRMSLYNLALHLHEGPQCSGTSLEEAVDIAGD